MIYDTSKPLDKEQFLARANLLAQRGVFVELKEKKQRTLRQNNFCHTLIAYFACQYGESAEYVKRHYFKVLVNPDIFIREKEDRYLGNLKTLRSTADLSVEEMSLCIDRFRNWSSKYAGIYLPSPDDMAMVRQMELEIARNERYL